MLYLSIVEYSPLVCKGSHFIFCWLFFKWSSNCCAFKILLTWFHNFLRHQFLYYLDIMSQLVCLISSYVSLTIFFLYLGMSQLPAIWQVLPLRTCIWLLWGIFRVLFYFLSSNNSACCLNVVLVLPFYTWDLQGIV